MAQRKRKTRAEPPAPEVPAQVPEPARRRRAADPGGEPAETFAHQLIPAAPAPPPPPRPVGPRRVVGHDTVERLLARRGFRPAGNSRRFWSRVEDDDPFRPQPHRWDRGDQTPTLAASEPAAADRLSRVGAPNAQSAPHGRAQPAKPPRAPAPKPAAPPAPAPPPAARVSPPPARPAAPAPPPRPPPAAPAQPVDRRPPLIRDAHLARDDAPPAAPRGPEPTVRQRLVDPSGRSADEVRRERESARTGGPTPPPARSFDDVMSLMSQLRASEELYLQGLKEEATEAFRADADAPAPPSPKPPPPSPRPVAAPAPVDRSPKRAAGNASLDDLFGGSEGRVRIGRRTVRNPPSGDADE